MKIDLEKVAKKIPLCCEFFDSLDSTSLYLKRKIHGGSTDEALVFASHQSNGRGRTGKSFYSPNETGLYVTFAFKKESVAASDLTPRVALAASRAIESVFDVCCDVKWVNDIYIDRKKVGGILCQAVSDFILIGIGINVEKPTTVPIELSTRFGSVCEKCEPKQYTDLLVSLYEKIIEISNESSASILNEFRKRCCHFGKQVKIDSDHQTFCGTCIGIEDDFSLMVEIDGEIRRYNSGYMVLGIE